MVCIERCFFLRQNEPASAGRAYVGHMSCPGFLEHYEWIASLSCPATLVLPPLRDAFLQKALTLTERFAAHNPSPEVSCGDLGTLALLHKVFPGLPLCAGPLLFPQDTDPLIFEFCTGSEDIRAVSHGGVPAVLLWVKPSERCVAHWAEPSVFGEEELLKAFGVTRLEICAQPIPPQNVPSLPVTVYESSFFTILPCRSCRDCASLTPARRGGKILTPDKNLLCYEGGLIPSFADRIVSRK